MDKLAGALQENILTLLVYSEKDIPLIMNSVDTELFESSVFKDIASVSADYYRQFKKPIAEHLPDVLEHKLGGGREGRKAQIYEDVIHNLHWAKDTVNREYIISQLQQFIRKQNLKLSVRETIDHLEAGDLDGAESSLESYRKKQLNIFDVGTPLFDPTKMLAFLSDTVEGHDTNIALLDSIDIRPAPKELFTFVALPRRGKTWFMVHVGKNGFLNKKKILHISLEMSEQKIAMRYIQSLFAVSKREASSSVYPIFKKDQAGNLLDIEFSSVKKGLLSLTDKFIKRKLTSKLKKIKKPQLIIKEFPTRQLTISKLRSYLDGLESLHGFIPDIILLDYADLMAIDSANLRIDTGRTYADLRGLAQERMISIVTASQANREAERTTLITGRFLAEDYSKLAISDNVVTYNQTSMEKECNLARLYVEKGRGDRSGDVVLISQNYERGQFCLDSIKMSLNYEQMLKDLFEEKRK